MDTSLTKEMLHLFHKITVVVISIICFNFQQLVCLFHFYFFFLLDSWVKKYLIDDHQNCRDCNEAAGEDHESSREGADCGIIDMAIDKVREEGDHSTDEGKAGEDPPNLMLSHSLAEQGPG